MNKQGITDLLPSCRLLTPSALHPTAPKALVDILVGSKNLVGNEGSLIFQGVSGAKRDYVNEIDGRVNYENNQKPIFSVGPD